MGVDQVLVIRNMGSQLLGSGASNFLGRISFLPFGAVCFWKMLYALTYVMVVEDLSLFYHFHTQSNVY